MWFSIALSNVIKLNKLIFSWSDIHSPPWKLYLKLYFDLLDYKWKKSVHTKKFKKWLQNFEKWLQKIEKWLRTF